MYDPDRYRPKEEIEAWKTRDPIPAFAAKLREAGLATDADVARLEREVAAHVEAAIAAADAAPPAPVDELLLDVTARTP
jgi:TPP-dependent pyruvate/acetoin dehydrogenase alpha subunit